MPQPGEHPELAENLEGVEKEQCDQRQDRQQKDLRQLIHGYFDVLHGHSALRWVYGCPWLYGGR